MCGESCWIVLQKWRSWIRPFLAIAYVLVIIIIAPILIYNSIENGISKREQGALVGGVFVLLALPISFWQIIQHILNYNKPILQKHIIRILWMVPIYAVNAWVGLVFPEHSIYMDSLRECYEAYVIYNFMKYLLNYLNMEMDLEASLEMKPQVYHIFPLCCLTPWEMGREFVHMCKHGILQYTVVRPVTTAISVVQDTFTNPTTEFLAYVGLVEMSDYWIICELCGVYDEGDFRGDAAFPYMIAINNLSQFIAMYCLVLFYKANRAELQPMKPIGKFLCIKAVVFFSFFQGVLINILVYCGVISSAFDTHDQDTIKNISSKLQDFLICIEMFIAAVAHHYSFTYKPYVSTTAPSQSCCESFMAMWDVSDVHRDIQEHLGIVGSSLSRRIRGRSMYTLARGSEESSENSRLVGSAPENLGTRYDYEQKYNSSDETGVSGTYGSVGRSDGGHSADSSEPLIINFNDKTKSDVPKIL